MDIKNKDGISLQWLFKQASPDRWNLNNTDLARVLGINEELVEKLKANIAHGKQIELNESASTRLHLLLSINKSIHDMSPNGQENLFFTNPNSGDFLNRLSIKEFLIEEATTDAMDKVIVWLKSLL